MQSALQPQRLLELQQALLHGTTGFRIRPAQLHSLCTRSLLLGQTAARAICGSKTSAETPVIWTSVQRLTVQMMSMKYGYWTAAYQAHRLSQHIPVQQQAGKLQILTVRLLPAAW